MQKQNVMKKGSSLVVALIVLMGVLIMTGVFSRAQAAAVEEMGSVKLDFKEFAIAASEQPWWNDLQTAADDNTKYIGSKSTNQAMSAEAKAAYDRMQQYLEENCNWRIDESQCAFTNAYFLKQLYINSSEEIPWGLSYYGWYSDMPERNKLHFEFDN